MTPYQSEDPCPTGHNTNPQKEKSSKELISMPMYNQSTACNPHRNVRHMYKTIKMVHRVTPDIIQDTLYCHGSTMCNVTLVTQPQLKNRHHRLHGTLNMYRQPRTTLQNRTQTRSRQNSGSTSLSCNTRSPGLQDTRHLRNCSGNRAKMLRKTHHGIKCLSQNS